MTQRVFVSSFVRDAINLNSVTIMVPDWLAASRTHFPSFTSDAVERDEKTYRCSYLIEVANPRNAGRKASC